MRTTGSMRLVSVLVAGAVLTAGCGSTADMTAAGGALQGGGAAVDSSGLGSPDGLTTPAGSDLGDGSYSGTEGGGSGAPGGSPEQLDAVGSGGGSGSASGPGPAAGQAPARGASPAQPGGTAASSAPGVTASTLKFGVAYATDGGEANAALGASDLDAGDARDYYDALVKEANAAGGVAGRKLVPSYFEMRSTSQDSAQAVSQAMCEKWTRDDPVFAVFDGGNEILRTCTEQAGMVNLDSGASNSVAKTFQRYPHYIEVSSLALDRAGRATVEGLARTDYYGDKPVIGIVAWDDPDYKSTVESSMVPALRRLGRDAKEKVYIKVPQTSSGVSESAAAANNAVLRFRENGVTHVMIVDGPAGWFAGTGLTLLFLKAASSQQYFPRYGFNESNSFESGRQAGLWTADDIRGARAVSWANALDESDKGAKPNAQRKECLAVMARNGVRITNLNARMAALRACDWVWFLRDALGTAPTSVSRQSFLAAVHRLGTSYASPSVYGTRFGPGRHDGVGKLRLMKLDDGCDCFVYTSAPYDAP